MTALLEVNGLRTHFFTSAGVVKAVDGVTFDLMEGESLALVGESGCGKSITALSIMRLIPSPPGRILGGTIRFMGDNLLRQDEKTMRDIRGNRIGMVFQEPMTSLNVTIQAQILELIQQVQRDLGIAVIIITHNLGVVARYVDRINVMYAGRIVERGTLHQVFDEPQHPYTQGLLASVPRLDKPKGERLIPIEGMPPDLSNLPPGCAFRERCAYAITRCEDDVPEVLHVRGAGVEHHVACWAVETGGAA